MAKTPRILIVDENLDSRVETRKALQRVQFEVAGEVGFGTEAVTHAREVLPEAILLAVEDPVTRPLETAEVLANVLPDTPILFYATAGDAEAVRRAVLFGARDYLVKPLQAAVVRDSIYRALEYEEKTQMRRAGQLETAEVRGTIIAVVGAKGGIGKSVLSVNLALALRRRTASKVVIVDGDTHFGDVATMLDITPEVTAGNLLRDLHQVDRWKVGDYLVPGPEGVAVLAAPEEGGMTWEDAGPESGRRIVDLLSFNYDFIVVDTSGAMDSYVRALIQTATLVLLVTTGEVSSVRDSRAALHRLERWGIPNDKVKVVLNRGARADGFRFDDLEKSLGRSIFWELPRDKAVVKSIQIGQPVVLDRSDSPAARHIIALAGTIGGSARDAHSPNQNGSSQNGAHNGALVTAGGGGLMGWRSKR